ncbi:hypothetical protein [Streptomyces sp. NPDC090083]|uniref:hypothetical protein n=1 Tax=Streptomyces sp. NPDC090083 TaxID=3365941 RepID=UPI0037FE1E57
MDPVILAAASSLVGTMATDGWQHVHDATVALWRRLHPAAADAINEHLIEDRTAVLAARQAGDLRTEQFLVESWQRRFAELRTERADEFLDRLVTQVLAPALAAAQAPASAPSAVRMSAQASDNGRVYQSGRDQTINEG